MSRARAALRQARRKVVATTSKAEWLLTAALALTILEGAARKWLIGASATSLGYAAYLSKDVALIAIALLVRSGPPGPAARELARFVWLSAPLVLAGALLSSLASISLSGAFLSLRSMVVLPVVLALLGPRLRHVDFNRLARRLAYLVLPVAGLGILQFNLPPDHVLNRNDLGGAPIVAVGHVRATGTFSFISGMGHLAIVGVWCGLLLGAIRRDAPTYRLGLVTVAAGFACALACLSRGPAVIGVLVVLAALFVSRLNFRLIAGGALLVSLVQLAAPDAVRLNEDQPGLAGALIVRHNTSDTAAERVGSTVEQVIEALGRFPAGGGFGIGQVGGYAVEGGIRRLAFFEAELARVVVETGWAGFFGVILFRLGAIYTLLRHALRLPAGPRRERVIVSIVVAIGFFLGNLAFDHVASAFATIVLAVALAELEAATGRAGAAPRSA